MKKNKSGSIFGNVVNVGVGTIVNMIIGFVSTPIITRMVVPDEYGRQAIFTLYCSIAVMVVCLGLDQALVRYYYRKSSIEYRRGLLLKCISAPILVITIFAIVFLLISACGFFKFDFSDIPLLLVFAIFGELLFRYGSLELRLENHGKKYAVALVIHKAVYVVVAISLICITQNHTFFYLAVAFIISYIVPFIYCILSERDTWSFFKGHSCDVEFRELAQYGLPFVLSMGLSTLFNAIDKLSLKALCDYSVVGVYASATTLIGVFTVVKTSFNAVWAPMSVKHYEEKPTDTEFYTKINRIISYVLFAFGLTFIVCKDVFGCLLGSTYREAAQLLPFLALHPIMYTISETTVTGAVLKKKSYVHLVVAGGACVVNLLGNMVLIPTLGAKGAAISTGVSYIVFYALRTYFGNRYYKFSHSPIRFWISTIVVVVDALYNTFFQNTFIEISLYIASMAIISYLYKDELRVIVLSCRGKLQKLKKNQNVST